MLRIINQFLVPENPLSSQVALSTVLATEYTKDNISENGVISAEQQQRITSLIGGNNFADNEGIISFAEREATYNKGCIALLEAAPVINIPTELEIEYNHMEQINLFDWFFSVGQLNKLVLYMLCQNWSLVALDSYKKGNLGRTGKIVPFWITTLHQPCSGIPCQEAHNWCFIQL